MKRISLIATAMFLLLSANAWAQMCFLTTYPLNFGSYDTISGIPLEISGRLDVDCRPPHWVPQAHPILYQVSLNAGLNSGGSFFPENSSPPLTEN